jgi:hypothetical protein
MRRKWGNCPVCRLLIAATLVASALGCETESGPPYTKAEIPSSNLKTPISTLHSVSDNSPAHSIANPVSDDGGGLESARVVSATTQPLYIQNEPDKTRPRLPDTTPVETPAPSLPLAATAILTDNTDSILTLAWPEHPGLTLDVEIPAGAADSGTKVSLIPIAPSQISNRLPGTLVDGLAFRLLPDGLNLQAPVHVTAHYTSELSTDERYSLLHWNPTDSTYRPVRIVHRDLMANTITFALEHFSDYNLVYTFIEGLWLEKTGGGWSFRLYFEGWPGLVSAQLSAAWDGGAVALPLPEQGLFNEGSAGHFDVAVSAGGGSPGKHELSLSIEVVQLDADNPEEQSTYSLELWNQYVIEDPPTMDPGSAQELLDKYAPVFQFADDEQYFPAAISDFTALVTEIQMPSGRSHYFPGGVDATGEMGILGHRDAGLIYKGKKVFTSPSPASGTIYGQAFDLGGTTGLLYSLYFPWSQELGSETGTWGGHRGDLRYVLIEVTDAGPISATLSQHRPGVGVQYQGDPDMPVWSLSSWSGEAITVPWDKALRCKANGGEEDKEEHMWVFVGSKTHALYPRAGDYSVQVSGKGPAFMETAGGDWTKIWQPPGFGGVCSVFPQYNIELHAEISGLTSNGWDGHLLFSGAFGAGRYGNTSFAPYQQPWFAPGAWSSQAASPNLDDGTNCYRCLPPLTMMAIDGFQSSYCYQYMWICQCSACGLAIGNAFVHYPEGFQCFDKAFCEPKGLDGMCKTGVTIDWYSDEPLNGVPYQDKETPQHAEVFISIPYTPTCYANAEMWAGVQAHVCSTNACCTQLYGSLKGVCYPSL